MRTKLLHSSPPGDLAGGFYPLKSSDKRFPSTPRDDVVVNQMMQAKLTDAITIKLLDGFRARLDHVAAEDKRKPGQWARKVLEEAVEQWKQAHQGNSEIPMSGRDVHTAALL